MHNDGEPAVIYNDTARLWRYKAWYKHGELHNENGHAREWTHDFYPKEWWYEGKYLRQIKSEKEFNNWKKFRIFT